MSTLRGKPTRWKGMRMLVVVGYLLDIKFTTFIQASMVEGYNICLPLLQRISKGSEFESRWMQSINLSFLHFLSLFCFATWSCLPCSCFRVLFFLLFSVPFQRQIVHLHSAAVCLISCELRTVHKGRCSCTRTHLTSIRAC